METGEFQQALYTMHQLLDLRDKEVDVKVNRRVKKRGREGERTDREIGEEGEGWMRRVQDRTN